MSRTHVAALRTTFLTLAVSSLLALPGECPAQQGGREGRYLTVKAMNAMLDSIEALALTCEHSDAQISRIATIAVWGRILPARDAPPPPPPYPGIVARLRRIYRQCDAWTHGLIVWWLTGQAEQKETAALLGGVAQEVPSPDVGWTDTPFTVQYQAIEELSRMGADGRAVLQRLYTEGTVREPNARTRLEAMARRGFQRSP